MATKKKNRSKQIIQIKTVFGLFCLLVGLILLVAFASFTLNWQADQSQVEVLANRDQVAQNVLGKLGAWLGNTFILNGVGVVAFVLPIFFFLFALKILLKVKIPFGKLIFNTLFFALWLPIALAFIFPEFNILYGVYGFEIKESLYHLIGSFGLALLLIFTFLIYIVFEYGITIQHLQKLKEKFSGKNKIAADDKNDEDTNSEPNKEIPEHEEEIKLKTENDVAAKKAEDGSVKFTLNNTPEEESEEFLQEENNEIGKEESSDDLEDDVTLTIEEVKEEEELDESQSSKLVKEFGEFDPTLDLPNYKVPPIHLLVSHNSDSNVTIDQRELEANKNKIVETLSHYKIGIAEIKATIGPTVTLYEIVPEAGIRISKIKNLEDDIALSLSALGIRIIAPIPGKGTIGIEVPNSHPSVVSMRSVIASQKFQNAQKMELPIAFGKTISNETFVADLAKMPHLLMAGATGQGKSVGLNAIITSLLYKKHPAEIKFVFVDPKKVELTLYNKIERHFLAKLPNTEDAIITDNQKVINTLNSLCIEMDDRYELLKNAYVRNIKEYNVKFKNRKLNPENGHRYLPYIVLVVDEFADLIMTAGKEVEGPIARLAQLARAIGIHLIIATQRPSVNVITGIIKANFPARVAFRVTSKIDSRTILDGGGADQLIGKGDMLFTNGNEMIRLQCAFVDTPEVDEITEFIGNQKGYPDAFMLPEYEGEESSILDVDLDERDKLFDDAARVVVAAQQGSASLIQRKLKLGYNRAGRIIDQLEAAGIVGPFEGSKARQVLITDEMSLEQLLKDL